VNAEYICRRAASRPALDGRLDHPSWHAAEKSPRFVDMVSGEPGFYDTRAAALWDDEFLYVGFWAEEPFVRASLTERDSLIFVENDLELFIDGGESYYEFEVNALGTVYEVFFIWKDAFGNFAGSEWDLARRNVLSFAGNNDRDAQTFWRGTHPRGARWAFLDWDLPGLRWAVHVDGCINDDSVVDRGWTVELGLPWAGMAALANNRSLPPQKGDVWRMFFGRFEKMKSAGAEIQPHPAWVWTPHGVYDTHRPEYFTTIRFSNEVAG